jgi:L-arabinonolactonase
MMRKQEEVIDLSELFWQPHGTPTAAAASGQPLPQQQPWSIITAQHEDFVTARLIVDCHCLLGEGVLFDDKKHAVLWTDILASRFHVLQLNYDEPTRVVFSTFELPKKLCSFGMLQEDGCNDTVDDDDSMPLLFAWEDGFQLYDVAKQKELSAMSVGEDVNPDKRGSRLNDGRVDPSGNRFIAGGYYGGVAGIKMKVFQCEMKSKDGSSSLVHEPIVDEIEVANSISWNLDGSIMYLADSPTKQISSYRYDLSTGKISDKKVVFQKAVNEPSVPDGSCVDSEGYIWNALWRGGAGPGMVQRIDPATGKVTFTVHMPDTTSQVSCCCFGGKDMDVLFITTAAEGRAHEKEPHAGGLYAARLPFKGRKESRLHFKL